MNNPKVYVVILNWNGWGDTIECLESVFRLNYQNYTVIVCDNDSSDNSFERIKAWAEGSLDVWSNTNNSLRSASYPPVDKPIPFMDLEISSVDEIVKHEIPLVLIKNSSNLGFAAGNNVGLRYVIKEDDFEYVWLLNNDTVVQPDALQHLVERMREKPSAGICGSTLYYYDKTELVQSQGGSTYNKWLGFAKQISFKKPSNQLLSIDEVERQIDYVAGASMLVSRNFLLDIGLMSEDYFLYFEEIDWSVRGTKNYQLGYAEKSIVYHKEGASIGTSPVSKNRSVMSEYFLVRNRFIFTLKYFPFTIPTIFAVFLIILINRIRRGEWNKVLPVLTAALFWQKCNNYKFINNTN